MKLWNIDDDFYCNETTNKQRSVVVESGRMPRIKAVVVGVHVVEEVLCSLRLHDEIETAWLWPTRRRCVFSPLVVVVVSPQEKLQNYVLGLLSFAFVAL